jgi:hypothetical protein
MIKMIDKENNFQEEQIAYGQVRTYRLSNQI